MKRPRELLIAASILVLTVLACEGTGGYKETRQRFGSRGNILIEIGSVDKEAQHSVEISDDFIWDDVALDITLEVQNGGPCRVEFLDDSDGVVLALDAEPGQPAQGSVVMETDATGSVEYRVTAENAQGVKITIDFERQ